MRLLVVGAHAADFVWRVGGIIAKTAELGGEVLNLSLSYGEKGESGNLWKEDPNRSIESVKEARHEMSSKASEILGCTYQCLDWGDYPMLINEEREAQLAEIIRDFSPKIILTHTAKDPFNPDHPLAYTIVQRARLLSAGAGVSAAFKRIDPPRWFSFEPHQPELSGFLPDTYIDISSVFDLKIKAMECMGAQSYLKDYYTELVARRGNHARRISGDQSIKYAECLESQVPFVGDLNKLF